MARKGRHLYLCTQEELTMGEHNDLYMCVFPDTRRGFAKRIGDEDNEAPKKLTYYTDSPFYHWNYRSSNRQDKWASFMEDRYLRSRQRATIYDSIKEEDEYLNIVLNRLIKEFMLKKKEGK